MGKKIDLTGQRFGLLTVVKEGGRSKHGSILWDCICDCGTIVACRSGSLKSGNTKTCGCRGINWNHGRSRTPEYIAWACMIQRCRPSDKDARFYNKRGITTCERWKDFKNFYADMGDRPSPSHSLDRIDNDKGYFPGNCRWATKSQQNKNKRYPFGLHPKRKRLLCCRRGHPFTPENTYVNPKTGQRQCRTCVRLSREKTRPTKNSQGKV